MKILVTGGAGFIGSHFVDLLAKKGIDVCVFDSLISGKAERIPSDVSFMQGDIRDKEALVVAMQNVTHVVHLAALVSVAESMADPLETHAVNVTGTEHVLDAMRTAGVKRIVYASSAAVYGDESSLPKREDSPLRPQSPYALSKVLNETQSGVYERIFGLSTIGLRFFNVYGPRQLGNHPYASVIPRWIEAIRGGKAVTIYGDGSQTRDFVHVRDVALALYNALVAEATGVLNIASGAETSLQELQQNIAEIHTGGFEVRNEPSREGDILRSVADISAARRALNFTPSVGLHEGISELLTT